MIIELLYQDKFKFDFEKDLFNKYKNRLGTISRKNLSQFSEKRISQKKIIEIINNKNKNNYIIILDETGRQRSTEQFKDIIFGSIAKKITFIVGGTNGFTKNLLEKSDLVISLSKMTLTHSFAAIILLEQIYRSVTIKINHPYHRK